MKRAISIICFLLLFVSGFNVLAYEKNISNAFNSNVTYDLLIIAPEMFSENLQQLIEHKNNHNVKTVLKTTEEIYNERNGRDQAEKIKYFIKEAFDYWNIKYVLFVGGKEQIPVRYVELDSSYWLPYYLNLMNHMNKKYYTLQKIGSIRIISDLYYADIYDQNMNFCNWDSNNNDLFGELNDYDIIDRVDLMPEISVGRLLCKTNTEVKEAVSKIINYENNAYGSEWFNNIILVGGDSHSNIIQEIYFIILYWKIFRGKIAFEGEYMCEKTLEYLNDFNEKKIYASSSSFTVENINDAINEGASFLLLALHGSPTIFATHPPFSNRWLPSNSNRYHISEIQKLNNLEKLPIAVLPACSSGDFSIEPNPFAWEFVRYSNGGAIASFGLTSMGFYLPSTLAIESQTGHLAMSVFEAYSEGIDIVGEIWSETIKRYLDDEEAMTIGNYNTTLPIIGYTESPAWVNHITMEEWMLFGDPSLKIGGFD